MKPADVALASAPVPAFNSTGEPTELPAEGHGLVPFAQMKNFTWPLGAPPVGLPVTVTAVSLRATHHDRARRGGLYARRGLPHREALAARSVARTFITSRASVFGAETVATRPFARRKGRRRRARSSARAGLQFDGRAYRAATRNTRARALRTDEELHVATRRSARRVARHRHASVSEPPTSMAPEGVDSSVGVASPTESTRRPKRQPSRCSWRRRRIPRASSGPPGLRSA